MALGTVSESSPPLDVAGPFRPRAPILYPNAYAWFIVAAALDVVVTWMILHAGGSELNALADWVIRRFDIAGVVSYKFLLVALVLVICEVVGRRNARRGLLLACWAVALTVFPVVVGLVHLLSALVVRPA